MQPQRLLVACVALVVLVAGCTGTLVEVRSAPATIAEPALSPVGYVHGNTTEVPLTYPVGVGPVARDVTVYVWVSGYSRTVESDAGSDVAGLVVVSSPNHRVEGQSVNPFAHLSNRELVAQLLDLVVEAGAATGTNVTDVADLREAGVRERTVLGQSTEVTTDTATVRYGSVTDIGTAPATAAGVGAADGGATEPVFVHLTAVEHGDDVVFALGVHGESMDEAATMADLMEAIEHEADASG